MAAAKDLLRLITCGSVDDGKSTLIGRLLYESGSVNEDEIATLELESRRLRGDTSALDFSLLFDGLAAEREQGITIDVAYRPFETERRRFIIADAPGHEQYTRNMATGASTADCAILVVDARKGIAPQTRRHGFIVKLLGIRHVVLAVTKMDMVDYAQDVFDRIAADWKDFTQRAEMEDVQAIPLSGTSGDNVAEPSRNMLWYDGPALLDHLERVQVASDESSLAFAMPVQRVLRPGDGIRAFSGLVAAGRVGPGDRIRILPSGTGSTVARLVAFDADPDGAEAGQSITLTLADEVDCSRGDVIAAADAALETADQFEAAIVWMGEQDMLPGRSYWLKIGARTVIATVTKLKHQVDLASLEEVAADKLTLNGIGVVNLALSEPIVFAPYEQSRALGGFILIDRMSNDTIGAGMIRFALRRSSNLHDQAVTVDRFAHAAQKGQRPRLLWLTGLSGAGKSTIADIVERKLYALGRHSFLLDGDNVRQRLNRDLGFTDADRVENIRRVGEVARLMMDAGLIVIAAFISPFRAERRMVREMVPEGEFVEIFVDVPLALAEGRDPKGLYRKARAGQLRNFTGIDSPYEPPEQCEIHLTPDLDPEQAADRIIRYLEKTGL